jgi:hypothetical protein
MTKEEVISAMKECVAKLGRTPRSTDFYKHSGVSVHQMRKHFGTYVRMVAACGLEQVGRGFPLKLEALYLDWARVTRKLGRIPTKSDYYLEGNYSPVPYGNRYRAWSNVPQAMKEYAIRHHLEGDWEDVLKIIEEHLEGARTSPNIGGGKGLGRRGRMNRPLYGRPLFGTFSFVPANEQGVLLILGAVAHELGFFITRVQTEFPDVEALREIGPNLCQRTHWELEYESRNFREHLHPLDGCDGIICWINNWPDCPLEVIELRSVVERLAKRGTSQSP